MYTHPEGVDSLVLFVSAKVKEIARQGRSFPWDKPRCCPRCQSSLWWHGFVLAYFAACAEPVYLRRLRCPGCNAIHRLRPAGYFRRIRSSILEVKESLSHRAHRNRWRPDLPRGRQRQWWRRLCRLSLMEFGCSHATSILVSFYLLIRTNIIPITSAMKNENRTVR